MVVGGWLAGWVVGGWVGGGREGGRGHVATAIVGGGRPLGGDAETRGLPAGPGGQGRGAGRQRTAAAERQTGSEGIGGSVGTNPKK